MPSDTELPNPSTLPIELVDRVLSGTATPAELARVEAWAAASPEHTAALAALRTMDLRGAALPSFTRTDVVATTRPAGRPVSAGRRPIMPGRARLSLWSGVAGAVLAVLVVLVGWRMGTWQGESRAPGAVSTYTTGRGQRAAITLPDGSRVVLNVASRLDIPADYLNGNRTVTLEGAAFFTVEHQSRAPFTVLAGQSTTRVLGTSFVVRHYTSDSVTTVAVRDGKVSVRDVILTAGQQVQVAENGTMHVGIARDAQFGFVAGTLSLDNLPISDAMTELSRWYDVELRLGAPSLASLRMTGEFAAGSVSDLQTILELTYDVRVVRAGRVLTLYPR